MRAGRGAGRDRRDARSTASRALCRAAAQRPADRSAPWLSPVDAKGNRMKRFAAVAAIARRSARCRSGAPQPRSRRLGDLPAAQPLRRRVRARPRSTMSRRSTDKELIEMRDQRHADRARPAFELPARQTTSSDMQVQTSGEFGGLGIEVTHGERLRQGRVADRRHAGRPRRRPARRPHHPFDGEQVHGPDAATRRSTRCAARSAATSR